jgi:uncharacterized protein
MPNKDAVLTPEMVVDISTELGISRVQVENTLKLILDDCTIPFIARYRKEVTGALDEVQIRDIRDKYEYLFALSERKETILRSIDEQGKLTPELKAKVQACKVKAELEDLYLPYKPKKRTRGQLAKERGLEPLALQILNQKSDLDDLVAVCTPFVGSHEDLKTLENVLQGAKDYIAEVISETPEVRGEIRQWTLENGVFRAEAREEFKDKKTKFNNYFNFSEPVKSVAGHRLMALRRGEKENILKVTLEFDAEVPVALVSNRVLSPEASKPVGIFLSECVKDAYTRIISPSIETELRLETKSHAEEEAIHVFAKNLRNLLLLPPIPRKIVLGVDPGIRTGSKLVVVDPTGKLLEHTTIYPDLEAPITAPKNLNAVEKTVDLMRRHKVEYVSVGNGTASREVTELMEKIIEVNKELMVRVLVVNEAGASVYSASDVAREEFPDLDLTFRGAVSIARRLQDPLAELVKIDPKSIGVGQYQHDVNQSKLKKSLEEVVESCVNFVGVNLNTASPSLLSYVAGIGPTLAKNIVRHRDSNGEFANRVKLFEVMGFGPKAFEQAAGFLRIPTSENPLDNTAVHPESYAIVEKMARDLDVELKNLIGKKEILDKVKLETYATAEIGLPTLQDILKELLKPGRDPREEGAKHIYNREVKEIAQLKEGQILVGTVTNVTNFGAFVDIGVHQDGLIHISELSTQFIKNPAEAIAVGEQVRVKVIGVDRELKRISLSRKALEENAGGAHGNPSPAGNIKFPKTEERAGASAYKQGQGPRPQGQNPQNKPAPQYAAKPQQPRPAMQAKSARKEESNEPKKSSTAADLLAKFNQNRT